MAKKAAATRTVKDLRRRIAHWRAAGEKIALVPTMGALHDGHLSLVRLGQRKASRVVVSIFVNPAQFSPNEDFDKYPRTWDDDLAKLATVGADLVWAPTRDEMYPPGFATQVIPGGAADGLETDFRPSFFAGVATVCCKLFTQVLPDYAMFGEKDYQQLCVIRQMVRDLNLPLEIVGCPTVRETDGLAMSSRNRYLSEEERVRAAIIPSVMKMVIAKVAEGGSVARATGEARRKLAASNFQIDYVEVRDAETLEPFRPDAGRPGRILIAAWQGQTRLIDNMAIPPRRVAKE